MIHGWGGGPEIDFFPWAKEELTKMGFEVVTPEMPDSNYPKIDFWIKKLADTAGTPREDDILIGHSIGCQTIQRYLETLPTGTKVQKIILIAPWTVLTERTFTEMGEDRSVVAEWLEKPINYEKIKPMTDSWTAVFSDDDPFVDYEQNYRVYQDKLGAKIILEKSQGHFSSEQGVDKIPFLLDLVK